MESSPNAALLRALPAVERLLEAPVVAALAGSHSRHLVVSAAREVVSELRQALIAGLSDSVPGLDELAGRVSERVARLVASRLTRVINATGTLLHTNLGRALLAEATAQAAAVAARSTVDLEIDLETGKRSSRYRHIGPLLTALTGAQDALAVNNNAAAVMLVVNTLAKGREVVVSRGELVEIGGSFRVPDIVRAAGARLVEVGTTNKTKPSDYERAIGERTALLLKTHTSNYRIVGFTRSVSTRELAEIGARRGVPVFEDLGSGCLVDLAPYGLTPEPTAAQVVAAGVDLVSFSTDKLLGGPQGGVVAGGSKLVARLRANPMTRAIRIDKVTMAMLESTLRLYLDPAAVVREIPLYRSLARSQDELAATAKRLVERLALRNLEARVMESRSRVGGGACPADAVPTAVVSLSSARTGAQSIARLLRQEEPPVLGRIEKEQVLLDMRTIDPGEEEPLARAIESVDRALDGA
jgi:L-seryl-tRNA(Ser) seleniumtransferase